MPPYIGVAMNTRGPTAGVPMSRFWPPDGSSAATSDLRRVERHRDEVDAPQRAEQLTHESLQFSCGRVGSAVLHEDRSDDLADGSTTVDLLDERQLSRVEADSRTRPVDLVAGEAAAVTE